MEQAIEQLLGKMIIFVVGLAMVGALTGLVLIECGWIVRLSGRLYWRCLSFVEALRENAHHPHEQRRPDQAADANYQRVNHPNGAGSPQGFVAQAPEGDGDAVARNPDDEGEATS